MGGFRENSKRGRRAGTPYRLAAAGLLAVLAGCSTGALDERTDQPPNAADALRLADLGPRFPKPAPAPEITASPAHGFEVFGDADNPAPESTPPAALGAQGDAQGGYTLNFDNAPVANVVKAVLGDMLGLGYVIDPRAQGSITLSTGRAVAKRDMLFVLESGLRAHNLAMVRDGAGYRISPIADGGIGPAGSGPVEPGYGVTIVPLQYVSGETLMKLLEGFAARPGALRTDPAGRLLVVAGTGEERAHALETVRSFDVDWLRGQSVGMFPVHNSEPEPVMTELEKILDSGEAGRAQGLVKIQAAPRQNAILVVAAGPDLLRAAARWIAQLDSPSGANAAVKVYKARYGDAKQMAQLLNDIFLHGAGGGDSPSNSIAPESGSATLSASQQLTGGRPGGGTDSAAPAASAAPASPPGGGAFGGIPAAALSSAMASASSGGSGGGAGPLLPGVRITSDPSTNSVLIYADAQSYKIIERALAEIDRPKLQVAIDVTIAEVSLNDQLNYGVQFYLQNSLGQIVNSPTGQPRAPNSG